MLKVMSLMKRKEGMSFADYRNWIMNDHPKLATRMPGLRGYRVNAPKEENPDAPHDSISEMWFDDAAARTAAMATEAGKAAGADAAAHCSSRFHFLVEEKVLL